MKDKPIISSGFFTASPQFRQLFPEIMGVFVSQNGIYVPEKVEFMESGKLRSIPFRPNALNQLFMLWKETSIRSSWHFLRGRPFHAWIDLRESAIDFNYLGIQLERDYFVSGDKPDELVEILKQLYTILHPAYGDVRAPETVREFTMELGKITIGADLKRALPDIYWANFLGPEYVEMFGSDRVFSAPCRSVERLSDGGALLILSPSPLDFLEDPKSFEKLRIELKNHLGQEAFDTWPERQGKVPRFRHVKAENNTVYPQANRGEKDALSRVSRSEWQAWILNNRSIATKFVHDMESQGFTIDFSPESLGRLDDHFEGMAVGKQLNMDFVKEVAAYVSQIIVEKTGASWSFETPEDIPSLVVGNISLSPLARTQKALLEREKFEPWYRFATEKLIPSECAKTC